MTALTVYQEGLPDYWGIETRQGARRSGFWCI